MGLDEVRALFAGDSGLDVEIWVFAQGEDIQQVYDQVIMRGSLTSSSARLAATPQEMGDVLNNVTKAVGLLPRHWKMGSSRYIYTVPGIPVLAIVQAAPQGPLADLIACLQQ
jgi:hypothetical protein